MVQQARRESVKADELVRSLTPRPNWHKLDAFAPPPSPAPTNSTLSQQSPGKGQQQAQAHASAPPTVQAANAQQPPQHAAVATGTTRDMVEQLAADRKQALMRVSKLEPLQGQLQQALHLLEPEAGPSCVQLQLVDTAMGQTQDQPQRPIIGASTVSTATAVVAATAGTPRSAAVGAAAEAKAATPRSKAPIAARPPVGATAVAGSSTAAGGAAATSASDGMVAGASDANAAQVAEGLGWSSSVPRYLRWDSRIALQPYTLQSLYAKMQDIWAAKAAFDGQRQAQHPLLGFVWTYFTTKHGEQGLVAQQGYSFLAALRQHQHQLAMAAMFLRLLEGQWQEAMWHDCRHMLHGVALVLETLSECPCRYKFIRKKC